MCSHYQRDSRGLGLPKLFSAPNKIELMGLLANVYPRQVTPTEMVRTVSYNYTSLYRYLNSLTDLGLVEDLREPGRKAVYYTLSPDSETTDRLEELHDACLDAGLVESENTFHPLLTSEDHARIVASLVHLDQQSFTRPVVCDHADVSRKCFQQVIPKLQDVGLADRAGKDGKAYRYEYRNPDLWERLETLETTIRDEFGAE